MEVLSIWELKRRTKRELFDLLEEVIVALGESREGTRDHDIALANLRSIRWVLAHHTALAEFAPR